MSNMFLFEDNLIKIGEPNYELLSGLKFLTKQDEDLTYMR